MVSFSEFEKDIKTNVRAIDRVAEIICDEASGGKYGVFLKDLYPLVFAVLLHADLNRD